MSPAKLVAALALAVLLCAASLGFAARDDQGSVGDPSSSRLSFLTDLFPQKTLSASDLGNADCFDAGANRFEVAANQICEVEIPDGVKLIEARYVVGAPRIVLTRQDSLTQEYSSDDDPQDPQSPADITMPIFGGGTLMELSCAGGGGCALGLR